MAQKKKARKEIVGFTKPGRFLFFKIKPKPIYKEVDETAAAQEPSAAPAKEGEIVYEIGKGPLAKQTGLEKFLLKSINAHKGLVEAMKEHGLKENPILYADRMFKLAVAIAVMAAVLAMGIMLFFTVPVAQAALLAGILGFATYMSGFNGLLTAPLRKTRSVGKDIEKDVLFAARDMIVSMRSGMPLFNAMATVSEGYGASSDEFGKIIKLIQLGTPIESAVDQVSAKSGSKTFQRLMLQASTSIKVGADIVSSLQEVINDVSQERVIELRRYGQRLNAIAMFYMLFGIIFPSMGVAVIAIMSTFISIFAINDTTLIFALFGLAFLQFIFLKMIAGSRPAFST